MRVLREAGVHSDAGSTQDIDAEDHRWRDFIHCLADALTLSSLWTCDESNCRDRDSEVVNKFAFSVNVKREYIN
jgi:hypothetical protein